MRVERWKEETSGTAQTRTWKVIDGNRQLDLLDCYACEHRPHRFGIMRRLHPCVEAREEFPRNQTEIRNSCRWFRQFTHIYHRRQQPHSRNRTRTSTGSLVAAQRRQKRDSGDSVSKKRWIVRRCLKVKLK